MFYCILALFIRHIKIYNTNILMLSTNWSNRLSFIITSAAFAVGLGNIWRFPYVAGESGGGAFLLVYIILIFLVGIPIMLIEIALGRMSKTTPLVGYSKLSNKPLWNGVGWLGIISSLLIMSYYVMIMAWIVIYIWESISGNISQVGSNKLEEHFTTMAANTSTVLTTVLVIMALAFIIIKKGLKAGLENYSKIMMVGLITMLIGLTVWGATLEGAAEGYRWFLYPEFSKINLKVIVSALGQIFFSIGVGMSVSFVFGSYTNNKENLITSTAWIIFADTFFAILAGLLIFPIIFSFGLSPDSGPNLIFVTMTSAFNSISYGAWLGAIFFLLLFLAGFTSLISTIQGIKDSFKDKFNVSENQSLLLASGIILSLAVPVVFSFTKSPFKIFDKSVFILLDYITNTIMLPLGGLLITIFAAYVIGFEKLKAHIIMGAENAIISPYWRLILKWVIPLAILTILINGII